jgi:hypothetical protein
MQQIEIGAITLVDHGDQLRVALAAPQSSATWSVAGASLAVGWLLAWITHQDGQTPDEDGRLPVLDKTLRALMQEALYG